MKNLLCITIFILLGAWIAAAQVQYVPSGGVMSSPGLFPSGTTSLPGIAWSSDPTTGLWYDSSSILFSAAGTTRFRFSSAPLLINSTGALGWSSSGTLTSSSSADTIFRRAAAASIQLGTDAGTPITQTIKAHDAVGSNVAGADFYVAAGRSTGSANGGALELRTTAAGGAGSSLNNPATRVTISSAGEVTVYSISSDGTGKAVCILSTGALGTCTDAVGAGGTCTCA